MFGAPSRRWTVCSGGGIHILFAVLVALLVRSAVAGPPQKKQPPARPIDLNRATLEQLESLPGVGPAMARSILDFRRKSGPFKRPEDLLVVKGISRRRFARIRPYIVVHPAPSDKPASHQKKSEARQGTASMPTAKYPHKPGPELISPRADLHLPESPRIQSNLPLKSDSRADAARLQ